MKITGLETVQLPHLGNILWLRVHTDEGLIGLGETFRGADAVARYLHTDVAPLIIGRDPSAIDAISKLLTETYVGFRSSGVEMRAASAVDHRALGHRRQGRRSAGASAARRPLAAADPHLQHLRRLHLQQEGPAARTIGAHEVATEGPYEDQIAFNRDAGALAQSLLEEGITAMKIWPFDPYAVASGGTFIHRSDLDKALVPFRQIRDAVGDRMEVMVELHSMWDLPSALAIARALQEFRPFWAEDPIKMQDSDALALFAARSGLPVCASETVATRAAVPRDPAQGRGRLCDARHLVVRRSLGGEEDCHHGRGLPAAGRAARLHRAGGVCRLDPPLAQPAERDLPGIGAGLLQLRGTATLSR